MRRLAVLSSNREPVMDVAFVTHSMLIESDDEAFSETCAACGESFDARELAEVRHRSEDAAH
jgi:hypothetical protein